MNSKNVKKVLFVPNHSVFRRGDELILESAELDIVKALKLGGWNVKICSFLDEAKNSSLSGAISFADVSFGRLNIFSTGAFIPFRVLNYIYSFFSAPFYLAESRFAYIFCPGHNSYILALWCIILRIPYGFYVRGVWAKDVERSLSWNFLFKKARFMIVTGKFFQRLLSAFCRRVENEVPLTSLRPSSAGVDTGVVRHAMDILFVGRLHESKGILDLIRAVGLIVGRGIDVHLRIAGGGLQSEVDDIIQLIGSLGLSDQITLLGHLSQNQLLQEYKRSGIFAFPSYYAEGFPRVIYEAMMLGASIVTCEMPGTKEFIVDHRNCLIVPPRNPVALSDALYKLISNQELACMLRSRAAEDVTNLFSEFSDDSHSAQLVKLISADLSRQA
ncbi:MAG TPA: glycosyltransferase [Cellvibrionaceae bacterium]|nr:glycosyltransferase [Cellvibrionaceae bacterium]